MDPAGFSTGPYVQQPMPGSPPGQFQQHVHGSPPGQFLQHTHVSPQEHDRSSSDEIAQRFAGFFSVLLFPQLGRGRQFRPSFAGFVLRYTSHATSSIVSGWMHLVTRILRLARRI